MRVLLGCDLGGEIDAGTSCELVVYAAGGEVDFQGGGLIADGHITEDQQLELEIEVGSVEFSEGATGGGLATAFRASSQLVANVVPGRLTQFIGLLDVKGSYRQIVERGHSIHVAYFPEQGAEQGPR
jgi:hypothetical protein